MILSVNISIQCDIPLISSETWAHTQEAFFSRSLERAHKSLLQPKDFFLIFLWYIQKQNTIKVSMFFHFLFVYNYVPTPCTSESDVARKRGGETVWNLLSQTGLLFLHPQSKSEVSSKAKCSKPRGGFPVITIVASTLGFQRRHQNQHPLWCFAVRQKQGSFFPFGKMALVSSIP